MTKTRRLVEAKADLAYVLRRIGRLLWPPVTITAAPDNVIFDRDVEIRVRDGTILRANIFRPIDQGRYPLIMCAHPSGGAYQSACDQRNGPLRSGNQSLAARRRAASATVSSSRSQT